MSEFSDRPFVGGTLTGVRSFRVDSLGRLTGVAVQDVWQPGENTAECHHDGLASKLRYGSNLYFGLGTMTVSCDCLKCRLLRAAEPTATAEETAHQVASLKCSCGFYGYFDQGHNPNHGNGQVLGLVEAYGVATVGTRGFRAEKARIIALIHERRRPNPFARLLHERLTPTLLAVAGIATTVLTVALTDPGLVTIPLLILGLITGVCGFALTVAAFIDGEPFIVRRRPAADGFDRVRSNYGVPVYPTLKAALRDFPLTPEPPPTPETAADFWTRSAP